MYRTADEGWIEFYDLTPEAQQQFLDIQGVESEEDGNFGAQPIAFFGIHTEE